MLIRTNLIALLCLLSYTIYAQEIPNVKFGKVTAADFNVVAPVVDSNTNAVVLADIGSSKIIGNNKGWFSLVYTHIKRVKIINKKGLDMADVSIGLYFSGSVEEKLSACKAITYNLENGQVIQTKLETSNIFKEKKGKYQVQRKFTFPNAKEGSILEYSYTIESDFIQHLRDWEFQGVYPRLFTQYSVSIPEFLVYVFLSQGYFKLNHTQKDHYQTWSLTESNGAQASEHYSISGNETEHTWNAFNVPALKEEPYTSSMENHIAKIDFQISQYRFPNVPAKDVLGNWKTTSDELMKDESFGGEITRPNIWLNDDVKKITANATNDLEKAKAIYTYVRDNFTASGYGFWLPDNTTLRDVFRKKNGNIAEINLLLIAMLRVANLSADPVLISTRDNGWAHPFYPLINKYNYVICQSFIDDKKYYLDATEPKIGFGRLAPLCYNGPGFVVKEMPEHINLDADSVREFKSTLLFLVNDEKKGMTGSFNSTPGYVESTRIRKKLVNTSMDDYFKEIQKQYLFPVKISDKKVDSLSQFDNPVSIKYDIDFDFGDEDIIYLNPLFTEGTKTNPFTSAERQYPVEIPFKISEVYVLNMEVPKGYKVDELPKSVRVKLNDEEGEFSYIINASADRIMLQSKIDLKKANYNAEDYQTLRDFFAMIAKKHSEQIVLKKIK